MSKRRQTLFERDLAEARRDPKYDRAFRKERAAIDLTDKIVRALDVARVKANLSKAELARRVGAAPETLRRLFTKAGTNPSASLLAKLADELGCELVVEPKRSHRSTAKMHAEQHA